MVDQIYRQAAIDAAIEAAYKWDGCYSVERACIIADALKGLPSAQPETYKEKLKEIADALSEKFAYMHTCLNERDIILGYLGVKHSNEIHCNTDCTNTKCESYHFNKRLPSAQPMQWIPCSERMPKQNGFYLLSSSGTVLIAYYSDGEWLSELPLIMTENNTAWMLLPQPYKEGQNG